MTVNTFKFTAGVAWFVTKSILIMTFLALWAGMSCQWFGELPGRWNEFLTRYDVPLNPDLYLDHPDAYWLSSVEVGFVGGSVVIACCMWAMVTYIIIMYFWRKLLDSYYRWCMIDLATVCDVEVGLTYDDKGPKIDFPIEGKLYRARVPLFNSAIGNKAVGPFVKETKFSDSDISVVSAPTSVGYCVKNGVTFGVLFRADIGGEDCLVTAWHVWKDLDGAMIVKPGGSKGLSAEHLPRPFAYASVDENGDGLDFVIIRTDARFVSTIGLKKAKLALDLGSTCRTYGPVPEVCGSASGHISDMHDFPYLYYTASTLPSWSGGPVFDANGHVVAVHLNGGSQTIGLNRGIWVGVIKSLIRERRHPASFKEESKLERKRLKFLQALERRHQTAEQQEDREYEDSGNTGNDDYVYVAGERHEVSQEYRDHMRTTRMRKVNYSNLGKLLPVTIDDQLALVEAMPDGEYYVVPFEDLPPEQQRELALEQTRREELRIRLAERQLEEAKRRRRVVKDVKPAPVPVKSAWNTQFKREFKKEGLDPFDVTFHFPCGHTMRNTKQYLNTHDLMERYKHCHHCDDAFEPGIDCMEAKMYNVEPILKPPPLVRQDAMMGPDELLAELEREETENVFDEFFEESLSTSSDDLVPIEVTSSGFENECCPCDSDSDYDVDVRIAKVTQVLENTEMDSKEKVRKAYEIVRSMDYDTFVRESKETGTHGNEFEVEVIDYNRKQHPVSPVQSSKKETPVKAVAEKSKKKRKRKPKTQFKQESAEPQLTYVQAPKEEAVTTPLVAANQENGQSEISNAMVATAPASKRSSPQILRKDSQSLEDAPEGKDNDKRSGTIAQLPGRMPQYKVSTGMFGPLSEPKPNLPVSAISSAADKIFKEKLIARREQLQKHLTDLVSRTDPDSIALAKRTLEITKICEKLSSLGEQLTTLSKAK